MTNFRLHGSPPYPIAVIHGGPGAPGSVAPVARELSRLCGVLEPFQTALSLEGQLLELKSLIDEQGEIPSILVGHSWGAWLGYILAARYPSYVKKLILVGSGPFEEKYVTQIAERRINRLSDTEKKEYLLLLQHLSDPLFENKNTALTRLGALVAKTDAYDPLPDEGDEPLVDSKRGEIYQKVWQEAAELRRSGKLLGMASQIQCPVMAIHGDYDPHPVEGVEKPLAGILPSFRFILLPECGHEPWKERLARDSFFQILRDEVGQGNVKV